MSHQYENPRNQATYASVMDGVLYFTGEMDSLDTLARPLSYMYVQHLLPARHSHTKHLEVKEEEIDKTVSSA